MDATFVEASKECNTKEEKADLKAAHISKEMPHKLRQRTGMRVYGRVRMDEDDKGHEGLIDPANTASDVWADTAYHPVANEAHLVRHGKHSPIITKNRAASRCWRICPRRLHEIMYPCEGRAPLSVSAPGGRASYVHTWIA